MKKKTGCLIPILFLIIIFIVYLIIVISNTPKDIQTPNVETTTATTENTSNTELTTIFDAEKYSRITKDELISELGEPVSTETWTNSTSKGDFEVTTFLYDINSNHLEFIIADDSVVRLSIYSNNYWNNEGERFSITGKKEDICKSFNIILGENAKITTDNNFTFTLSPVNNKVAMFDVQDINENTYGFVKITYNLNYFD